MSWGKNDRACSEAVKAKMVKCADCDHCRSIGEGRNTCPKRPGTVMWTNAPQICKFHSGVEWREALLERMNE